MLIVHRVFMTLGVAICAACVTPTIRTRYGPLHPEASVDVDFRVQAQATHGVRRVELFLYEYAVTVDSGAWSGSQRPGGRWGLVDSKEYTYPFPGQIDETFTQPGFADQSYVRYAFRVTQAFGGKGTESWGLAAGDWSGAEPIPILVRGSGNVGWFVYLNRIDLCFVADRGDELAAGYATGGAMLPDLAALIFDGYQESNAQEGDQRFLWQYYYSPETGHMTTPGSGDPPDIPAAVKGSGTIDVVALIHPYDRHDWTAGNTFSTEPQNRGTALHETGHALFHLDDEYSYPSAYGRHHTSLWPHHNNYDDRKDAEDYNLSMGWPVSDVESIDAASKWWRPEPKALGCIMFDDGDDQLPDFGRTCILRVQWFCKQVATRLPGFPWFP